MHFYFDIYMCKLIPACIFHAYTRVCMYYHLDIYFRKVMHGPLA